MSNSLCSYNTLTIKVDKYYSLDARKERQGFSIGVSGLIHMTEEYIEIDMNDKDAKALRDYLIKEYPLDK